MELAKRLKTIKSHDLWEVWRDWVYMGARAVSQQSGDWRDEREAQYLERAGKYTSPELITFAECIGALTLELAEEPKDVLGELFQELELHNRSRGQFFTPISIADAMAALTLGSVEKTYEEKGFVTINDPACGSGVMLIAAARVALRQGVPLDCLYLFGQDIDECAVHMTYLQVALMGCPGAVIHGDTLRAPALGPEIFNGGKRVWRTPAWIRERLRRRRGGKDGWNGRPPSKSKSKAS